MLISGPSDAALPEENLDAYLTAHHSGTRPFCVPLLHTFTGFRRKSRSDLSRPARPNLGLE